EYVRRGAVDAVVTFGEPVVIGASGDRKQLARSLEGAVRQLTATTLRGRASEALAVSGERR
ncbi:MAG: 1-acyl-sn-glycerol-3-phosphate acyltransferase, partial [Panacagrimonas sp.]